MYIDDQNCRDIIFSYWSLSKEICDRKIKYENLYTVLDALREIRDIDTIIDARRALKAIYNPIDYYFWLNRTSMMYELNMLFIFK